MPRYRDVPSYTSCETFLLCITRSLMDVLASILGFCCLGCFWGSVSACFIFSPIWGCLSRKAGIPTTVMGAAGLNPYSRLESHMCSKPNCSLSLDSRDTSQNQKAISSPQRSINSRQDGASLKLAFHFQSHAGETRPIDRGLNSSLGLNCHISLTFIDISLTSVETASALGSLFPYRALSRVPKAGNVDTHSRLLGCSVGQMYFPLCHWGEGQ